MNQEYNNQEQWILEEIKKVITEYGTFPPQKYFYKIRRYDILGKIQKINKGLNYFREKLGYKPLHRQNYWTEEEILNGLKILIERLGRPPKTKDIKQSEFKQIIKAVRKYGGIRPFQEKLGYSHRIKWTEDKILEELQKLCEKLGHFPSESEMHCTLNAAIHRNKQSVNDYRKKLGYKLAIIPNQWKNWGNVKQAIEPLIKNDIFPTQTILNNHGIAGPIAKWGGIAVVAEKMGCSLITRKNATDGHYVNSMYELLFDEFLYSRGINHKVNGYIGDTRYRFDFKVNDSYIEIWGYPKNKQDSISIKYNKTRKLKEKLYKKLNYNLISIECEVFTKKDQDLEKYFISVIERLGLDPTPKKAEYSVKEILRKNFNLTEDKVISKLGEVINQIGHFPSQKELKELDEKNLLWSILRLGGINKFRELTGYKRKSVPIGYWTEENIKKKIICIVKEYNRFPSTYFLAKINRKDLAHAIEKSGGIKYYRSWHESLSRSKPSAS